MKTGRKRRGQPVHAALVEAVRGRIVGMTMVVMVMVMTHSHHHIVIVIILSSIMVVLEREDAGAECSKPSYLSASLCQPLSNSNKAADRKSVV